MAPAAAIVGPGAAGLEARTPETIDHIVIVTDLGTIDEEYRLPLYRRPDNPLITELLPLTSTRRTKLRIALARLPAKLYGSISKLSIAVYEEGDVAGDAIGNHLIVNAALLDNQGLLNDTVAHEATHGFHALVRGTSADADESNITQAAHDGVDAAQEVVRSSNISQLFANLQRGAKIASAHYPDYAGEDWNEKYASPAASIPDGFITPYAAEEPREDLAEIVMVAVRGDLSTNGYCTQFDGLDKPEPNVVLVFAKIKLTRALGLLTDAQVASCLRNVNPDIDSGIKMGSRTFDGDVGHGTQTVRHEDLDDDWLMWRLRGESSDARLELRLRARKMDAAPVGTMIGFHRLDAFGSQGMAADALMPIAAQNVVTFQRKGASNPTEEAAYTRISGSGYVLITDFGADRLEGIAVDVRMYPIIDTGTRATDEFDVIPFLWERNRSAGISPPPPD